MTLEEFIQALAQVGIQLSQQQIDQFDRYYQRLIDENQKVNLTTITDRKEVYLKHFFDSLTVLWQEPFDHYQMKLCDVGAGAGFPGIPLKLIHPEIELTIVDSLNKRINFLHQVQEDLGLQGLHLVHGRAEDVGQNPAYRGQFDLVTARAVASLDILAEYCLPLVRKGGYFIALKGGHQQTQEEVAAGQVAIKTLGGKLEGVQCYHLPHQAGERSLVKVKKTLDTPNKYPRKAGKPSKQPIH